MPSCCCCCEKQHQVVILLGPPGGGKGTQAKKLIDQLQVPQISTGDLFRKAIAEGTDLGKKAKTYMDQGKLVPDEVTFGMLKERIALKDCAGGFILDGFPRTRAQAEGLTTMLKTFKDTKVNVLGLEVPDQELIKRLTGRRTCGSCGAIYHIEFQPPKTKDVCDKCGKALKVRDDDTDTVVKSRLKVYQESTAPVVEYYKGRNEYKAVKGSQPEGRVFEELLVALGKQGKVNK